MEWIHANARILIQKRMNIVKIDKFSVSNHFALYCAIASLNFLTGLVDLAFLIYYFSGERRRRLSKTIYQMLCTALAIGSIVNFGSISRIWISSTTTVFSSIYFFLLIFGILCMIFTIWLMLWLVLSLYIVLDSWLERVLPFLLRTIYFFCGIELIYLLCVASVSPFITDPKAIGILNTTHEAYFLFLLVFAAGTSLYLVYHLHRVLETYHNENGGQKLKSVDRIQTLLFTAATVLVICGLCIVCLFPESNHGIVFEIIGLVVCFVNSIPAILMLIFYETMSLALVKKRMGRNEIQRQALHVAPEVDAQNEACTDNDVKTIPMRKLTIAAATNTNDVVTRLM